MTPARGPPSPLAPRPGSNLSLQAAEAPDPGAHTRAPGSPGPPRLGRPHPGRPRPAPPPYRLAPARQPAGLALVRHRLATRSPVRLRPGPPSSRHPARLASAGLASAGLAPARLVQVRHRLVIRAGLAPVRHPITGPASPRPASPRSATVSPAFRPHPGPPPGHQSGLAPAGLAPLRHRLASRPAWPRPATRPASRRSATVSQPGHRSGFARLGHGWPRPGPPLSPHPAGLTPVRHRLASLPASLRTATRSPVRPASRRSATASPPGRPRRGPPPSRHPVCLTAARHPSGLASAGLAHARHPYPLPHISACAAVHRFSIAMMFYNSAQRVSRPLGCPGPTRSARRMLRWR